ncbi:MAG: glycosyltransferase [Flavobacteriaceae bacterium]
MISILIPTYNYHVQPLVETVHKQCELQQIPFEIVVREDASTQFLQENKAISLLNHVQYLRSEKNIGRTKTRQALADAAKHNWLLFLDADVMPVERDFIENYLRVITQEPPVVFGGIMYHEEKPQKEQLLRWVYGKKRESKTAFERRKNPHYIISQNIMVQKNTFLEINNHLDDSYGMDNIFSYRLQKKNISVMHIENPVYHNGLEKSETFLKKSLLAIETLIDQEKKGTISTDFTSLQKGYTALKKVHIHHLARLAGRIFNRCIIKNLQSRHPSIPLLDLYKLSHYSKLKDGK